MTFPLHFFRGVLDCVLDESVREHVRGLVRRNGLLLPDATDAARCFNDAAVSDFFGERVPVLFWLTRTPHFAPPQKLVLLQWMHANGVDVHRRHEGTNLSVLFAPEATLPYLQWCHAVGLDFTQTLDETTVLVHVCSAIRIFTEEHAAIIAFLVQTVGADPFIAGPDLDDVYGCDAKTPFLHLLGARGVPDDVWRMLLHGDHPPVNADGETLLELALEAENHSAVAFLTRAGFN